MELHESVFNIVLRGKMFKLIKHQHRKQGKHQHREAKKRGAEFMRQWRGDG